MQILLQLQRKYWLYSSGTIAEKKIGLVVSVQVNSEFSNFCFFVGYYYYFCRLFLPECPLLDMRKVPFCASYPLSSNCNKSGLCLTLRRWMSIGDCFLPPHAGYWVPQCIWSKAPSVWKNRQLIIRLNGKRFLEWDKSTNRLTLFELSIYISLLWNGLTT